MFQKREKKLHPYLILKADHVVIFDNFLSKLPFREEVILEKSILFFNDPEPCYIHRNAVRVRLLAEIEEELKLFCKPDEPIEYQKNKNSLPCLLSYVQLPPFTFLYFTNRA